tara:strand:- start:248 stop:1324 length:1077 start_codon:yes stop_codon:yes gene_type:complete
MWRVTEEDLLSISIGAGILGTGGGGNPYIGMLRARETIRQYGPVTVLSADDLQDTDKIVCVGGIGAPTVGIEKVRGKQSYDALIALENHLDVKATALISNEIGGSNSLEPLIPAAISGLPVVDADGMGRAFPEFQMKTFFVYGVPYAPMAIADEKGNVAIIPKAITSKWVERIARSITIQMGSVACYALAPMTAAQVRNTAVKDSLTLSKSLGDSVRNANKTKSDPINAMLEVNPGKVLYEGKISGLQRKTTQGFARGEVTVDGSGAFAGTVMTIEFQNENLIARIGNEVVCVVPDLISIVDSERGEPITTELLRYGFRVTVIGFPSPDLWTTEEGLQVVGPSCFGYDVDYTPLVLTQ